MNKFRGTHTHRHLECHQNREISLPLLIILTAQNWLQSFKLTGFTFSATLTRVLPRTEVKMPGVQGKYTIDVTNRFGLAVDEDDQVRLDFYPKFHQRFRRWRATLKTLTPLK